MAHLRMALGYNIAYTPAGANEVFLILGPPDIVSGTQIPSSLNLNRIEIFQNNTNAKSITVSRVIRDNNATSVAIGDEHNRYNGQVLVSYPNHPPHILTCDDQPTVLSPAIANIQIGGNVGDNARLVFEEPVECQMILDDGSINHGIGLRVTESTALDLMVTFVYEIPIAFI